MNKKIFKSILDLTQIKQIEKDLLTENVNYPYCIGIDGATATGKTVFANLLKEYLQKKLNISSEIFQLDYLLLNRNFREREFANIKKNNVKFFYEAENHMRFNKINDLIIEILKIKKSNKKKLKIKIDKLYSRKNNGKCNQQKIVDLSKKVLIFEGHYTSRNIISSILDKNIILFSTRKEILKRKINRSQNYRNSKDVIDYFDYIDLPSITNNFLRFYKPNFHLINNNDLKNPKTLSYKNSLKIIKFNKQNNNTLENIFGNNYSNEKLFFILNKLLNKVSSKSIEYFLKKKKLNFKKYFFYKNSLQKDVIFIINENNKKYFLIQNKINKNQFLLSFENGFFLLEKKTILNLGTSSHNDLKIISNIKISEKNYVNSKLSIFENFFKYKNKSRKLSFLSLLNSNNDKFLLFDFFKNSGWQTKFLDDFCFLSPNYINQNFLNKKKIQLNIKSLHDLDYTNRFKYENKELLYNSKNFYINYDFCKIKREISKQTFSELEKLILSDNYLIRKNIYNALLNYKFSSNTRIKKLIKDYIPLYPTSFSRLYAINKILNMQTGILANNVYDLSDQSADITAYLEASNDTKLPFVLQSSLNAIGHEEKKNKIYNVGYLKAKEGPLKYIRSISKSVSFLKNKKKLKNLFYGIGLDHVDLKGDRPKGRTKRFLIKSLKTKSITHVTLDFSDLFNATNANLDNLSKVYQKIFYHSNLLIMSTDFGNYDLEYCTGELNYISKKNTPHYPDQNEISMFEKIYNLSIDKINNKNKFQNFILKNKIKLYVANLGTTHHGNDKDKDLKIDLSKKWNIANHNKTFISPVLHGTTNSKDYLFKKASKNCLKINIAGSYLNVLFSNLDEETKNKIKFKVFDKNTKYLAYKLVDIPFERKKKSVDKLKKKFIKYASLTNYKNLKLKDLNELRMSTFYLEDISKKFLLELKKILDK